MNNQVDKVKSSAIDGLMKELSKALIHQKILGRAASNDLIDLIDALRTAIEVIRHGSYHAAFRKEKQLAGIAKAKAVGTHFGRPATIDYDAIRKELADGLLPNEIVEKLGCSRAAVYRCKGASDKPNPRPSKLVKHHDRIIEVVKTKGRRDHLREELGCGKATLSRYIQLHVTPYLEDKSVVRQIGSVEPFLIKHHDRIVQSVRDGEKRVDLQEELGVNRKTLYKYIKINVLTEVEEQKQ